MFRRSLFIADLLLGFLIAGPASAQAPAALWPELQQAHAAKAYRAMRQLATMPDRTLAFLRDTVPAAKRTAGDKQIAELIRQLDSDQFAEREHAQRELERLDWQALPMLCKAVQGGGALELKRRLEQLIARAEGPLTGANLRLHRAIEVVEWIGSAQAKSLLERWSQGDTASRFTGAAAGALKRWPAHDRVDLPAPRPTVDAQGDPLPNGAVLRLGSTRWRLGPTFIGYEGGGVVFSADGKRAFIAAGTSIDVMDAANGKALRRRPVQGHISGMQLSPDGRRLLVSNPVHNGNVTTPLLHVWDAADLKDIASWNTEGAIEGFVDGGKQVVLSTAKGLRRLDPASGQEVSFTPFAKGVQGPVRAFNGKTVVVAGRGLSVFDLATPEKARRLDAPDRKPRSVALSADGKYLAIGGDYDYGILIYDLVRGEPIRYISAKDRERDMVLGLAFAPDAKTLAFSASGNKPALVLWDLQTHRPRWKVEGNAGQLVFSRDGKRIAGNGAWRTRVWDAATGKELSASDPADAYEGLAFGADGRTLIARNTDTVRLLDFPGGKERIRFTHPQVHHAELSPDGRWLATSGFNHDLRLWDARSGRELSKLPDAGSLNGYRRQFTFTGDSRRLCTWEADGRLRMWDVSTSRLLAEHRPRPDGLPAYDDDDDARRRAFEEKGSYFGPGSCFAADGARFFWYFKKLRAYDTASGRVLRTYDQELTIGYFVPPVSNDGALLLTGGGDNGITLFDLRRGKIAGHLQEPVGTFIGAYALAPDGRAFAVQFGQGAYHRIVLTETATMQPRLTIPLEYSQAQEVSFSPDGRFLAARLADRTVVIYDLRDPGV
jgi:WD40 repeat protein